MSARTVHVIRCYARTGDLIGTKFDDDFGSPLTAKGARVQAERENAISERRRAMKMPGGYHFKADRFERTEGTP